MSGVLLVRFEAGDHGNWAIERVLPVAGPTLETATHLKVSEAPAGKTGTSNGALWRLTGVVSNIRYAEAGEATELRSVSPGLSRPEARKAALIPIRKSAAWWALAQDERRTIFEEQSRHIGRSMKYLPAIARRLHHARDLGEPFDFLTWFEFAPEHEPAFETLLAELRGSPEWAYVEREVDVRLTRTV